MGSVSLYCLGLGMARAYALRGEDGFILVDAGYDGPALEAGLAKAGIDPADIVLAIVTHAHHDHTGGLPWLESRHKGLAIAVGAADATAMEEGVDTDLLPLGLKGRIAGSLSALLARRAPARAGLPASLAFAGGESLSAYGVEAEIVATPGHTRGSISVVLPEAKDEAGRPLGCVAVVGDLVMGGFVLHGRPQAPFFASGRGEIAASLGKLRERGVASLYTGHGGPVRAEAAFRKFGLS